MKRVWRKNELGRWYVIEMFDAIEYAWNALHRSPFPKCLRPWGGTVAGR